MKILCADLPSKRLRYIPRSILTFCEHLGQLHGSFAAKDAAQDDIAFFSLPERTLCAPGLGPTSRDVKFRNVLLPRYFLSGFGLNLAATQPYEVLKNQLCTKTSGGSYVVKESSGCAHHSFHACSSGGLQQQ